YRGARGPSPRGAKRNGERYGEGPVTYPEASELLGQPLSLPLPAESGERGFGAEAGFQSRRLASAATGASIVLPSIYLGAAARLRRSLIAAPRPCAGIGATAIFLAPVRSSARR